MNVLIKFSASVFLSATDCTIAYATPDHGKAEALLAQDRWRRSTLAKHGPPKGLN